MKAEGPDSLRPCPITNCRGVVWPDEDHFFRGTCHICGNQFNIARLGFELEPAQVKLRVLGPLVGAVCGLVTGSY